MQEIEDNFKSNGGKFEEFRIGDLFDIQTGSLIDSSLLVSGSLKRISAKSDNNGVLGSYNTQNLAEARHYENFISVNFFGDTFYHPYKASVEMKVHTLHLKKHIFNSKTGLYIAGVISKIFKGKFSYGNQLSSSKLKKEDYYITLPTQNGEIAFDYMEAYIKELEAYLMATGLKDYTLSSAEQTALETFKKSIKINNLTQMMGKPYLPAVDCSQQKSVQFQEFKIGELFEKLSARFIGTGDKFKSASKIQTDEYCVPLVYAKSGNNGIMYWAKQGDFETHENVLSVIYNGAIAAGLVYAQPKETGILAESYFIKLKQCEVSFKVNLFLKTALEKTLYPKYSREYLATWTGKVEYDKIQLPTQNNVIDFDFMHTFIRAIEKIVIKEVVEWADKKIQATKQIINRA